MGLYSIKPKFQHVLLPIQDFFIQHHVSPTTLNISAVVLAIVGGLLLYSAGGQRYFFLIVPLLAGVRIIFNALDGMIARKLKVRNAGFGEVMNEFGDRLADVGFFAGLVLAPYSSLNLGFWTMVVILLNSYLSIVSKAAGGTRQYGGFMGKADRMLYLSCMCVAIFFTGNFSFAPFLLLFVLVGTLLTLGQRFLNIKKELYT